MTIIFCIYLQVWTIIDLGIYSIFVCKEICDHLRVYLFYITPSTSKFGIPGKIIGLNSKNGSSNSSGLYQHHSKYSYPSNMNNVVYSLKTKTK